VCELIILNSSTIDELGSVSKGVLEPGSDCQMGGGGGIHGNTVSGHHLIGLKTLCL